MVDDNGGTPPSAGEATDIDAGDQSSFSVTKPEPTSILSSIWDATGTFIISTVLVFSVFPLLVFLIIGRLEGNLRLPGANTGFLEAPSFLSVFLMIFLLLVAVRYALEKQYRTLEAFNQQTLRFKRDEESSYLDGEFGQFASELTEEEFQELLDCYSYLLARATFRGDSAAVSCPDAYRDIARRFRLLRWLLVVGGAGILAVTTYYHWYAEAVYGFDIWASSTFPMAFFARFIYEAVLLLGVGPILITQLLLLCFLNWHPFRFLQRRRGLRFQRFALDGVGGFGKFGNQAFKNVLVLLPLSIQLGTYAWSLPTTGLLVFGVALYILSIPTLFFAQLFSAHRAMQNARQIELEIIGTAYAENYENYKQKLVTADSIAEIDDERLVTQHEALEKADVVYDEILNRPTWPFKRSVLGKIVSLVASLMWGFGIALARGTILI